MGREGVRERDEEEGGRGKHKRDINGFVINEKPSDERGRAQATKIDDDDEMLRNNRSFL